MSLTFEQAVLALIKRSGEWDSPVTRDFTFRAVEQAGEVGELQDAVIGCLLQLLDVSTSGGRLFNLVKKYKREKEGLPGSRASLQDIEDEIGDNLISVMRLAVSLGIDPERAFREKFNATSDKLGLKTRL